MISNFENSWARVARAKHHANALAEEWRTLLDKDSMATVVRYDKDSGWYVVGFDLTDVLKERIRLNTLSLKMGEVAYQLRAALDGLIWQAITLKQNGAEPAPDAKGVTRLEFPVLSGKDRDFKTCAIHNFPFPDQLKTWIESIQPDSAEKPLGDPDRGLNNALENIHDLARFDRHRKLSIIAANMSTIDFALEAFDPVEWEMIETCDLLSGQYEFLRFNTGVGESLPEKTHLHTKATVEIEIEGLPSYVLGEDVGVRISRLINAVRHVITRFEVEFQ